MHIFTTHTCIYMHIQCVHTHTSMYKHNTHAYTYTAHTDNTYTKQYIYAYMHSACMQHTCLRNKLIHTHIEQYFGLQMSPKVRVLQACSPAWCFEELAETPVRAPGSASGLGGDGETCIYSPSDSPHAGPEVSGFASAHTPSMTLCP